MMGDEHQATSNDVYRFEKFLAQGYKAGLLAALPPQRIPKLPTQRQLTITKRSLLHNYPFKALYS